MAQERGIRVMIATKLRHGDANTMMAEGGIQAATKETKDSPYYHYLDVLGGGHFKNPPELAHTLVTEAPKVIAWLERLGCMFTKFEDGRLRALHGGGTCRKRMHYAADITGAEIMRTLRDEARNRPEIKVVEFMPAVELILNEHGHCAGAVLYNIETEEYFVAKAKAVILATGGSGRLHYQGFMTTNHYGATGTGSSWIPCRVESLLSPYLPVPSDRGGLSGTGGGDTHHRKVPGSGGERPQHRRGTIRERKGTEGCGIVLLYQGMRGGGKGFQRRPERWESGWIRR